MKIDKRNPAHWLYLARFGFNVLAALVLRVCARPAAATRPLVVLYGHTLSGNLRALYDTLRCDPAAPCDVAYLGMDPAHYRALVDAGESAVLAQSAAAIRVLARARIIVSDHGLHVMHWLPWLRLFRFVDVWHGVPFKGWDAEDFRHLHGYDEVWVSSTLMRRFYIERFGFAPRQVHVTGYGRTDRLVRRSEASATLRRRFDIPPAAGKLVLFAPTWHHDGGGAEIFPFGQTAARFFDALGEVCRAHAALCLFRCHQNSSFGAALPAGPFVAVPQHRYPDTEGVLLLSDVLICDWSSIAFDFLLLDRPTVFLDIPAPFPKGYTLGPEYRFGAVVQSIETLCVRLDAYLRDAGAYHREFGARAAAVRAAVYDDRADGHAAERYVERLRGLL